jgi:phosphate transport system permease protein
MQRLCDRVAVGFAWATSLLLLLAVASLLAVVAVRGGRTLGPTLLFGETPWLEAVLGRAPVFGGLWPALVGTLALVGLASVAAGVVGVAAGIYVSEYSSRRWRVWLGLSVDLLAGVPSVVMGLFGFSMILLLRRTLAPDARTCLLLSAGCIAMLVLPYLVRTTQTALQAVPSHVRMIGPSLGFTRWQNLRHVLLPVASRGILSGVMLAIGRAAEDTAVIMLTGAVANAGLPHGLLEKYEALPFRIYVLGSEYRDAQELAQGFGCALVLLLLTAGLLGLALRLQRGMEKRWTR